MSKNKKKWFNAVEGVKVYNKPTKKPTKLGGFGPYEDEDLPNVIGYIESKYDGNPAPVFEVSPFKLAPGITINSIHKPIEELDITKKYRKI